MYGHIKLTTQNLYKELVVTKCMLIVIRPSFEVVKDGRILNSGLVAIPTKHHQFDFGLF